LIKKTGLVQKQTWSAWLIEPTGGGLIEFMGRCMRRLGRQSGPAQTWSARRPRTCSFGRLNQTHPAGSCRAQRHGCTDSPSPSVFSVYSVV